MYIGFLELLSATPRVSVCLCVHNQHHIQRSLTLPHYIFHRAEREREVPRRGQKRNGSQANIDSLHGKIGVSVLLDGPVTFPVALKKSLLRPFL